MIVYLIVEKRLRYHSPRFTFNLQFTFDYTVHFHMIRVLDTMKHILLGFSTNTSQISNILKSHFSIFTHISIGILFKIRHTFIILCKDLNASQLTISCRLSQIQLLPSILNDAATANTS